MPRFTAVILTPDNKVSVFTIQALNKNNALEKTADHLYEIDQVDGHHLIGVYEGNSTFTPAFQEFGCSGKLPTRGEPRTIDAVMNAFGE